jgi:phospholipid/cholesterol/gamma-HCH transport system permease protein
MTQLASLIENLGAGFLNRLRALLALALFGYRLSAAALDPRTYNSATRWILVKQIYFTAVQPLPVFLAYALIISWVLIRIIVTTARDFGLSAYVPGLIVNVLVLELLPFVSVLFVALRSSAAINTEVALMHTNNELAAFEHAQIDPIKYEFMPRVVGGVLSVMALTLLSTLSALVVAFFQMYGATLDNVSLFSRQIGQLMHLPLVLILTLKSILFGLSVTLIPLKTGLEMPKRLFLVPVSVLKGMMRVFFAIILIEVTSLAFTFI